MLPARNVAGPSPARTFTAELSPNESPQLDVDYNHAGKQSIPATGLSPVRYAALWAASERSEAIFSEKPPVKDCFGEEASQ